METMTRPGIITLCKILLNPTDDFDPEKWLKLFEAFIGDSQRFRYSSLTSSIYTILREDRFLSLRNTFFSNLDKALDYAYRSPSISQDLYYLLLKFSDHADLAQVQLQEFQRRDQKMRETLKRMISSELSATTENITSQLVGLVAIFTALSFILFGGISSLDSIFSFLGDMISSDSRWFDILPPVIIALLWAFCMTNTLFVFMLFVLRIIDKPLHYGDKSSKFGKHNIWDTLQRFPILILVDYLLLCLVVLLLFFYIVAVTTTGNHLITAMMNHLGWFVFITAFFCLIGVLVYFWHIISRKILRFEQGTSRNRSFKKPLQAADKD